MNWRSILCLAAFAACVPVKADPTRPAEEPLAQARAQYPLHVCVVSNEHLNPGEVVDYVYKETGRPDRLVRFCCHKCVARFKADPARYLKKLDELAAKPAPKN